MTQTATATTETKREESWHIAIGESAYASIAEMVANLERAREIESGEFDWEEEAERLGFVEGEASPVDEVEDGLTVIGHDATWTKDGKSFDDAEEACRSVEEYPDEEEAREAIEQDPLSLQVRSGWVSPGEEMVAEEFELLLGTGGPAVRIVGDINQGCLERPRLQVQDWFKPWTEYFQADRDTLQAYCDVFSVDY
jgi:hypothetical protein